MDDEIRASFALAKAEKDAVKRYRHVELLIFLIKLKGGLEVPFERSYGGDIERAEMLYNAGDYAGAVRELRKVKADIIKGIRAASRQGR